ncbi:MAG: hypothetical protein AAGF89_17785, partial [Bacteroidota bacterium]
NYMASPSTKDKSIVRYLELARFAYENKKYAALKVILDVWSDQAILVAKGKTYPLYQHMSHTYSGLVALDYGDVERAKLELLKSANVRKSPTLSTFGPNMELAKALLEKGQYKVVLQFLKLVKKFWLAPFRWYFAHNWRGEIQSGMIPDFKANLYYYTKNS